MKRAFTLIELLIVIGLLGGLAMLVLPRLSVNRHWASDEALAPSEMMEIRRAYAAFEADCLPTTADAEKMAQYGLEILMRFESSRGWSFPESYDPARRKGWRGPYLEAQGTRTVYVNGIGQPLTGSGPTAQIPVVHDPRHGMDAAGQAERFYRVLREPTSGHLALVYIGANGTLECEPEPAATAETAFYDAFLNHHQVAGDGFDDIIRPLGVE
jgi:prepilin-type N-terminal cleavage/methylation domain-containing protein